MTKRVPIGDKISGGDHRLKIGKRVILPKSFVGSPRWYNSKFQDGMAICRKYHKPDFFITMTCNTNWTEIQRELRKGETAQDRPDLVARVFKLKKDQLIKDRSSFAELPPDPQDFPQGPQQDQGHRLEKIYEYGSWSLRKIESFMSLYGRR